MRHHRTSASVALAAISIMPFTAGSAGQRSGSTRTAEDPVDEKRASNLVGVIAQPGRYLFMTVAMGLLIVASTVLSVRFPEIGSWLFVATGLLAATWYAHMMKQWRAARGNAEAVPPEE